MGRQDDAGRPLQMVKVLSWTFFILILGSSLALSAFISNYAERTLLEKQKEFGLLLAENLNHQIYRRFTLPTLVGYGRISLKDKDQQTRLDQVIRTTTHSFQTQSVRIYDYKYQVAYATEPELLGNESLAGEAVKKAMEQGLFSFEIVSRISRLAAVFAPEIPPGTVTLKTIYPLRAEQSLVLEENPIMGILEMTQDITKDYLSVVHFERLIILSTAFWALVLFGVMLMVLRRADRLNAQRVHEREKLERELHQSEKLASIGRMVAGVAHEIRNPLGIIRSSAELLIKKTRDAGDVNTRILQAIYDESMRLSRTVGDFLDYARPRQPAMEAVDLSSVLDQAAVFLERECETHGAALERAYEPGLTVCGDKDHLYRAIYNVLSNSLQAMEGPGSIRVRGEDGEDGVRLVFTDTGPGFSEEALAKAREPFFTTKDSGTGLGLAIVGSIVESHGGRMEIGNAPEGGARVEMSFPAPESC